MNTSFRRGNLFTNEVDMTSIQSKDHRQPSGYSYSAPPGDSMSERFFLYFFSPPSLSYFYVHPRFLTKSTFKNVKSQFSF